MPGQVTETQASTSVLVTASVFRQILNPAFFVSLVVYGGALVVLDAVIPMGLFVFGMVGFVPGPLLMFFLMLLLVLMPLPVGWYTARQNVRDLRKAKRTYSRGLVVLSATFRPRLLFFVSSLRYFCFLPAHNGFNAFFLIGFILACASDLFDGGIARRMGIVKQGLREWDGRADVWFYAWIAAAVWVAYPQVIGEFGLGLLLVVALQCLLWLLDFVKFRRVTNYHAYSARIFGASLFLAVVTLFAFGVVEFVWWLVILTGTICMVEEMAMTLICRVGPLMCPACGKRGASAKVKWRRICKKNRHGLPRTTFRFK